MKKYAALIMVILMVITMMPTVLAEQQGNNQAETQGNSEENEQGNNEVQEKNEEQEIEKNGEENKPEVRGLENAIMRVSKNETRKHLTYVMSKIEEKRRQMFSKLDMAEITIEEDIITIKGKKEAKLFGLFRMKHSYKFEINENGEVKEKGWTKWLWGDIDEPVEEAE